MLQRTSSGLAFAAALLALITAVAPCSVSAEFYKWTDEDGQRRISNIPPQGVREDGTVVDTYHPYSIIGQHARMREKLEDQALAIEYAEAEAAEKKSSSGSLLPFSLDFLDGFSD